MDGPLFYQFMRPILQLWFKNHYQPIVINNAIIPSKGRVVLAGNHTHNLDCLLVGYATKRCVRYVAKDELAKGPLGLLFKGMGIIPVNRKIHDKSVIPACSKYLNQDKIIGIFPEGTINRTQNIIMPFKLGAVVMAINTHSPILPFAITGKYEKGKCQVRFGKLYYPASEDAVKETHLLEQKVIELLESDAK